METLGHVGGANAIQVVGTLFTEGNLSWQACLESVQTLHALDMKTKATPLDISVKVKVTKLWIYPQGYSKIKIYPLLVFMGSISKPLFMYSWTNNYLFTYQCFLLVYKLQEGRAHIIHLESQRLPLSTPSITFFFF